MIKRHLLLLPALLLAASLSHAVDTQKELLAKPLPPVFDPAAIDKSVEPCADFYQHSCGAWLKANPIPSDQPVWWRFSELDEHTRAILADILEQAASGKGAKSESRRKIGDYYASCLDVPSIDSKGFAPFNPEFDRIAALKAVGDLPALAARLHLLGANALFSFSSSQDYTDATMMIAQADQGGLGLPDRDYYLSGDFLTERTDYAAHLRNMFTLFGNAPAKAAEAAEAVMRVETALAKASMSRVERREPKNIHHMMTLSEFSKLTPSFNWKAYLSEIGAPAFKKLDVSDVGFFRDLEATLKSLPPNDWKAYLRWTVMHALASAAPTRVVDEDFDFYGKKLGGQKEIKARWKRCVASTDQQLGEALGEAYVEREFSPEAKKRVLSMVGEIEGAMRDDIKRLDWMSAKTKTRALEKLAGVANKIGYPDKWRDYSKLVVVRGDALGNLTRGGEFELRRQLAKIGRPVDRGEWSMTPPTDNAYYDQQMNDINFPAGILQPPNFDMKADDAANYGNLVAIVGHELTHGFDDAGRHYDARGNLKEWWTEGDSKAFEARAAGLIGQYGAYVAVKDPSDPAKDVHLDGKLTLGENVADNGGLLLSYNAFMNTPGAVGGTDPYTPAQRFFLSYAQGWCVNRTDEHAKKAAKTDPHSPGKDRVNGVVANSPEFRRAFSCKDGAPMAPVKMNRVW